MTLHGAVIPVRHQEASGTLAHGIVKIESVTAHSLATKTWCSMLGCHVAEAENAYVFAFLLQFWLLCRHPVTLKGKYGLENCFLIFYLILWQCLGSRSRESYNLYFMTPLSGAGLCTALVLKTTSYKNFTSEQTQLSDLFLLNM